MEQKKIPIRVVDFTKDNENKCKVCRSKTQNVIKNNILSYYLCEACNQRYFSDLDNPDEKLKRIFDCINEARLRRITLLHAINISCGFYTIDQIKQHKTHTKNSNSPKNNARNSGYKGKRCVICNKNAQMSISDQDTLFYLCTSCDNKYLHDIPNRVQKISIIKDAQSLVRSEHISISHAINVKLGIYTLDETKEKIATKIIEGKEKILRHGNCRICKSSTNYQISNDHHSYYLCAECNKRFFSDIRNSEVKADRLSGAISLANSEKIGLLYALNIERGLYGLEEAKRRIAAKKEERKKSTTDIFIVGRRLPGSFK